MKRRVFLALAAGTWLLGWQAVEAKPAAWLKHQDKAGRFVASFPVKPTQKRQTDSSPVGEVVTVIVAAQQNGNSFAVTYSDLPKAATMFGIKEVFENTKNSLLEDAGGNALSWTDISQFGPGKELRYETTSASGVAQVYLVGQRLYVADAKIAWTKKSNPKKASDLELNNFFANFSIQK